MGNLECTISPLSKISSGGTYRKGRDERDHFKHHPQYVHAKTFPWRGIMILVSFGQMLPGEERHCRVGMIELGSVGIVV